MNINRQKTMLSCLGIMAVIVVSHGNELSVATGINSSFHRGRDWYINYQKTTIPDPVEIAYQKQISRFVGFYSALQYATRTAQSFIEATDIDFVTGTIILTGRTVVFEKSWSYLSLAIGPVVSHTKNRFRMSYRAGFEGNIFIVEKTNHFGALTTFSREEYTRPVLFSLMTGVGVGYSIDRKTTIGLRSSISRTLTDVVKYPYDIYNKSYFINWHNSFFVSIIL